MFAWYGLAATAIIAAIAGAAFLADARRAVIVSALVALLVQLLAFAIARHFRARQQVLLGWGLGSLLRFAALVLYGVFVARLWRAPIAPTLLSFVVFLFVTTIVEPVFLTR